MKIFSNISIKILLVFSLAIVALGFTSPTVAFAATSPDLGAAATYSVLSGAGVTNGGAGTTTISGDLGAVSYTENGITVFSTPGNPHSAGSSAGALTAQKAVFDTPLSVGSQACDPSHIYAVDTELSTLGDLDPGVYCSARDFLISGTVTLHGTGNPATDVWIFRAERDVVATAGTNVIFSGTGGYGCNVWWRVANDATFTNDLTMVGNILAHNSITFGQSTTLNGRAFAYIAAVTMLGNTISGPTCEAAAPVVNSGSVSMSTITVVKTVINDNGGTKVVTDFPLYVNGKEVSSGFTNGYDVSASAYAISEKSDPHYTQSFSGDCDSDGKLTLGVKEHKICIITNNDIGAPAVVPAVPPLIDVVKVPSPLALPNGPGPVEYTYTLRNIGTVPVTDITMVGDTCSPIVLVSGDTNSDKILDLNETWVHKCTTNLTETHTNTVVATGWANGISAVDIASAHVVVGQPIVPPLIHITKIPKPLALLAGGGLVTYTKKVTNPGTVALNNVKVTDDKCSPVKYISGDTNGDKKLDPSETWTYTCASNLKKTTVNTAVATGEANGLVARDFAVATVVVAAVVPKLPNTGFAPTNSSLWIIATFIGVIALASVTLIVALKKHKI